jgi:hypothetical protein
VLAELRRWFAGHGRPLQDVIGAAHRGGLG